MEDEHIEDLINNEKEWRRHLVKKVDRIEKDVAGIKVWIWVGRGFVVATWGILVVWIKSFLKE